MEAEQSLCRRMAAEQKQAMPEKAAEAERVVDPIRRSNKREESRQSWKKLEEGAASRVETWEQQGMEEIQRM